MSPMNWTRIEAGKIEQAIGDKRYGDQNTDGSHSIRSFYDAMREAGATARFMLIQAAARQWHVPAAECETICTWLSTARRTARWVTVNSPALRRNCNPTKEELKFKRKLPGGI